MSGNTTGTASGKQEPVKDAPASTGLAFRAGLFVLFLICALAILLFGSNYYKAFPTNGNPAYAAGLSAAFLLAALLFKRRESLARYWPIAYAFFVASAVNLVSALFTAHNGAILRALGVSIGSNQEMALAKLYDSLLVVATILVLTKLSGADLGSLFLKRGNLKWGLGIGTLVLLNFFTSALIFYAQGYSLPALGSAIVWGVLFAFSNGFLEELWFRGLFMKKLVPLIGVAGTVLLTSLWFAAIHLLSVAYLPPFAIPIFLVNTLTLGLACGILMLKTDSIWGSVMIHAAADLYLFIAMLATH